MKQLEVQIMGQSYLLGCPAGGEQRLLEAVEKVDTAMCKIRDAGKVKARDRIAVLAALNLAFDVADRPASPAVPIAPTLNASAFASNDATATGMRELADDVRLAQLMVRLDQALGDDGRLL
jgi:cell division protein ZapA